MGCSRQKRSGIGKQREDGLGVDPAGDRDAGDCRGSQTAWSDCVGERELAACRPASAVEGGDIGEDLYGSGAWKLSSFDAISEAMVPILKLESNGCKRGCRSQRWRATAPSSMRGLTTAWPAASVFGEQGV